MVANKKGSGRSSEKTEKVIEELTNVLKTNFERKVGMWQHLDSKDLFLMRRRLYDRIGVLIDTTITKYLPNVNRPSAEDLEAIKRLEEIRSQFEITQEELANILGVSLRTVAGWLRRESSPGRLASEKISKLYKVYQEIKGVIKPQALHRWLFAHNDLLGDTIFHILEKGEYEKAIADIKALRQGVYI